MKNFLNIDNLLGIKIYCLGVLSVKHLWNAYLRILKAMAFCMISQDLGSTDINLNILHLHASLNNLNYLGCSILFPCIKADFVSCCQVSWIHIIFKNLAFFNSNRYFEINFSNLNISWPSYKISASRFYWVDFCALSNVHNLSSAKLWPCGPNGPKIQRNKI